jgi:hypothetical protein
MRLLVKQEIEAALNDPAGTALAYLLEGDPPQHLRHPNANVRSTSLELTIGEIFIPGSSPDDLGGIDNGKLEHNLTQGHTASEPEKDCEWVPAEPQWRFRLLTFLSKAYS